MPITPERIKEAARRLREEANAASGSVEEYIAKRLEAARAAALQKSRTRTEPAVPITSDAVTRSDAAMVARLNAVGAMQELEGMTNNYKQGLGYVVMPGTFGREAVYGGTLIRKYNGGGYVSDAGDGSGNSYNDKIRKYSDAVNARKDAYKKHKAASDAYADYYDSIPDRVKYARDWAYWKDPTANKLVNAEQEAYRGISATTEDYINAEKDLGAATIDKYRGTSADLLKYEGWANNENAARNYLIEKGVRESIGAKEVADYFNSYVSSPGFERIINNQNEWKNSYHPYRRFDPAYWRSNYTSSARDLQKTLLKNPMGTFGVFDLSSYPGNGFNYTNSNDGIHLIINAAGNPFLDQGKEKFPYWDELVHEMMHDYNFVEGGQGEALDQNTNTEEGHDSRRNEKHSDLEALRFLLYKEGIYDSRGERDATADDIKKLRERYPLLRQLKQMDDEKAAWMINHVAALDKDVDTANYAKLGGTLLREYKGGGGLFQRLRDNIAKAFSRGPIIDDQPSIDGGEIEPAILTASPQTARGRYKLAESTYEQAVKDNSALRDELLKKIESGERLHTNEEAKPYIDALVNMKSPSLAKSDLDAARDAYYSQIWGVNSLPAQLYRYYSRHYGYQSGKKESDFRYGKGADIIDLNKNVIRLTPESKQSTALFNEFVENRYPTVRPAKEYKDNPYLILGDKFQFPASSISIYGGIEDGKFRLDSLKNFNDNTTVIPARNIKSGMSPVSGIRIVESNSDQGGAEKSSISSLLKQTVVEDIASALKYGENKEEMRSAARTAAEQRQKEYEQFLSQNDFTLPYEEGTIAMLNKYAETGELPEEEGDLYRIARQMEYYAPGALKYVWPPVPSYRPEDENEFSYLYTDPSGLTHPISNYNASILDGKTVLGNPSGGVFVGRMQDISKEQLDALNDYLKENPSWIMRTDLGSFDQYRMDNPSLQGYLKQYYEHPDANDPNVYTIGTTEPNKLFDFSNGGTMLRKYPVGGPIDWGGIVTTNNRPYNQEYIGYINDALLKGGMNDYQRASVLANIIEESGGDPFVKGPGGFYGLLQWGSDRYSPTKEKDAYREIDNQVNYILSTAGNETDKKSWTHGGKGSGYNSFKDAMKAYNGDSLENVLHGYTLGYVRPAGGVNSYNNRLKIAKQILDKDGFASYKKGGNIHIAPSKRGTFKAQAKKMGMSVKQAASHILAHKEKYSSAMVKKANFARNFAGDGGLIERYGSDKIREAINKIKRG